MTIEDLIKDRDYDLIEYRLTLPKSSGGGNALFGYCKSENGELISLDGDSYSKKEECLDYEEWADKNGKQCLTVICEGIWYTNDENNNFVRDI